MDVPFVHKLKNKLPKTFGKLKILLYICFMKTIGIYIIRCESNSKVYVGSSKCIERRFKDHRYRLKKNVHDNEHLQNAYNLYGANRLQYTILEECSQEQLIERETFWVSYYQSYKSEFGFNKSMPGSIPLKEKDENQIHISRSREVICINKESGEQLEFTSPKNCSNVLGLTYSKVIDTLRYWKENIGSKKSVNGWIIIYKENYSDKFEYKDMRKGKNKSKSIIVTNLDTNEVHEYIGIQKCINSLKLDPRRLYECLDGTRESYRGYSFQYKQAGV